MLFPTTDAWTTGVPTVVGPPPPVLATVTVVTPAPACPVANQEIVIFLSSHGMEPEIAEPLFRTRGPERPLAKTTSCVVFVAT